MENENQQNRKEIDNHGVLFSVSEERRARATGRAPHHEGHIIVGGKKYRLTAWKNYMRTTGDAYISISVSSWEDYEARLEEYRARNPRQAAPRPAPAAPANPDAVDYDDMPF